MNEEKLFYLKHKNHNVATIVIDTLDGTLRKIEKIHNHELLPPGGNLSIQDLKKWWLNRAVPHTRLNIKQVFEFFGEINTQSLLVRNMGLSLTDHYWICPQEHNYKWENLNLFTNPFVDALGDIQFGKRHSLEQGERNTGVMFSPGASLQGELIKQWTIGEDGERYLIKGNYGVSYGMSCQQSINEVFATKLHEKQNRFPFARYDLMEVQTAGGNILGCKTKCFTTDQIELIPAIQVVGSAKKPNDLSEYEFFIQRCSDNGLDSIKVRNFLEYQIVTDFLLTNTDRHFNNFGVLRNTDTLKYVGMAPIFDSGNSMLWNCKKIPSVEEIFSVSVTSFKKTEAELLAYVVNHTIVDLDKLPSNKELQTLLAYDSQEEERIDQLCKWYQKKIEVVEKLQIGMKLSRIAEKKYIKRPTRSI